MIWFIPAIFSYLIFAVVFLVDKYLISGAIISPKLYAFYVGILGLLSLILAPFIDFYIPDLGLIFLSFLAGALFIYALFWFYKLLSLFETSRVVPAIGGFLPIFSFLLIFFFSQGKETFRPQEFLAFLSLISGTVLITYEKNSVSERWSESLKCLTFCAVAALIWALHFVTAKYVYLGQGFLNGFLWIRIGSGFSAFLFLIFSKELRREIFKIKSASFPLLNSAKTAGLFISNQFLGVGAHILQNWAIYLAPLIYVSLITALQGVQYFFLLIFGVIISLKSPQILKEKVSFKIVFQKTIAIFFISGGLILLAF